MPRHRIRHDAVCEQFGISFLAADLAWLKTAYGKKLTRSELVRCAIQDAKCWREQQTAEQPVSRSFEPHDVTPES